MELFRPKMESQVSLAQIGRQKKKNDRFNRIEIKLHLITLQVHEFTSTTMHYKNIYKAQSFTYKQGNVPTWHKKYFNRTIEMDKNDLDHVLDKAY